MAKTKTLVAALVLVLFFSLAGTISASHPATATLEEVKWCRVNLPTEGETGNWVLANGANVRHLKTASDGTLYCYANPSSTSYTLFKSTDSGYSWSYTGKVEDAIVDIATAPDEASTVYYATASNIYRSTDAGNSFTPLPSNPGGAGSNNIKITDIDVARRDGKSVIAASTRDTDDTQFGGVYILDEKRSSVSWIDTNIGSYDVCAVAFSPNFDADLQLVAVTTDETDTLITSSIDNAWGNIFGNATISDLVPVSATIAFPDDYDAATAGYTFFLAIDTGGGHRCLQDKWRVGTGQFHGY